eukprot:TRINITY_DN3800_c0_g1_i5.p1 TRINITY_DN3800_c0_g1~~TRINITY_DN3800_c0_g1_i5.p1  ORF type:complete len:403 (-),score=73.95 TRINITY_DN3800_c0_g1_i5:706-1914(-)
MNELLDYIVVEPSIDSDDNRTYRHLNLLTLRYPFYASEILQLGIKPVIDKFFTEHAPAQSATISKGEASKYGAKQILLVETVPSAGKSGGGECKLLEKLFSLAASKNPLNPVLAGYFFKAFDGIACVCKSELLKYLFRFDKHIDDMIEHVYNRSMSATLWAILKFEKEPGSSVESDVFEADKRKVIEKLVVRLESSENPEGAMNISWILCKIVESKQHLKYLMSKEVAERLFASISSKGCISLEAVLNFIMKLYQVKVEVSLSQIFNEIPSMKPVLEQSAKFLSKAKGYLESGSKGNTLNTAYGSTAKTLGANKLHIVEWMQALIAVKNEIVVKEVAKLGIGKLLLALVKTYYMNSILHLKVFNIFEDAIKSNFPSYLSTVFLAKPVVHTRLRLSEPNPRPA